MASYNLKAGKWKKVGAWYGTYGRNLNISVGTTQQCRWRRKHAWIQTGSAHFTGRAIVYLFNAWVDVRSPVDTTCTTVFE